MSSSGRMLAERWLADTLSSLPCSVYRHPAPDSATMPNVTIGLRTGIDVRSMGDPSRVERLTYDISAWDQGESSLQANMLAIDAHERLDGVPPVTYGEGTILSCRRVGVVPIDNTIEDGIRYQRDGALYVIEVLVN